MVEKYRARVDFNTTDPVYIEFVNDLKSEGIGLPTCELEDMLYLLSGDNLSPEHENKVKEMKETKAGIIMVIKEKELFSMWRNKKNSEANR